MSLLLDPPAYPEVVAASGLDAVEPIDDDGPLGPIDPGWSRDDIKLLWAMVATVAAVVAVILAFPVTVTPEVAAGGMSAGTDLTVHLSDAGLSTSPLEAAGDSSIQLMNMGTMEVTVLIDGVEPSVTVPAGQTTKLALTGVPSGAHELTAVTATGAVSTAALTIAD